ncbi:MAG: glucoamylase family protein [Elusimicrobiales bacterium]|nr:glucoamylase family protein [Elusimicrobiales bacterium]
MKVRMLSRVFLPLFFALCGPCQPLLSAMDRKDAKFLDMVQKKSFQYFIKAVNPANGLVLDKASNTGAPDYKYSPASIAAVGFGLAALASGAERGWVGKAAASERVKTTLKFFYGKMESERGFFYHFVDMETGRRVWDCELSSIDTALFLAGALTAARYFYDPEIKDLAKKLYERVDWQWMADGSPYLSMGWKPETGFLSPVWSDYNESMVMYILALGSPTYPLTPESWTAIRRPRGRYKDHSLILCPPLFTHQFSHAFIDFRNKRDAYADYFENSVQATLANRQFCIDSSSSFKTYGENSWGLTASIGPDGYHAYGAPPGPALHDGTVAPSAAAASIVFTPAYSIAAMRHYYSEYRGELWGRYGFADSFNLDREFFAPDAYGINVGPTVLMIENYRSGLIWKLFMSLPGVEKGMKAAGFGPAAARPRERAVEPAVELAAYFLHKRPFVKVERIGDSLEPGDLPLNSGLWETAGENVVLDGGHLQSGRNRQPGYQVAADLLANAGYLFLRLRVKDAELVSAHPEDRMYEDDSLEVYIDSAGDNFAWGGADDYQVILSPAAGAVRVREFFHTERTAGAYRITDSTVTARGYEAVLALERAAFGLGGGRFGFSLAARNIDRKPESDAKFNWFFLEPATYLGELRINGNK